MSNEENKELNFASEQAGEYWAEMKAIYGDMINIDDVDGTGSDGAITKGNLTEYMEGFPRFEKGEVLDSAISYAEELGVELKEFLGEENEGKVITDEIIESILSGLSSDADVSDDSELPPPIPTPETKLTPDEDGDKPLKGKHLINLTGHTFDIDGNKIEPYGKIKLHGELKASKRVKYAIEVGTLEIK